MVCSVSGKQTSVILDGLCSSSTCVPLFGWQLQTSPVSTPLASQCGPLYGRRLGWFKQLYARGMQRTSALSPVEVSERLRYLTRQMTSVVFCTVAGTLFAEHRALFGLVLTAR